MAFIEGTNDQKDNRTIYRHMSFIMIAAVAIFILMTGSADTGHGDIPTILMITATVSILMIFVSYRINPLAWKKLLRSKEYERSAEMSKRIEGSLRGLDDSHYVFNNIIFELFRIEHLVISPQGIFVIATIPCGGTLRIQDKTLFAGERTLETTTNSLWRVCHLVNIVLKKGFNSEIMPVPILVTADTENSGIDDFDQITILHRNNLRTKIMKKGKNLLDTEQVQSYAYFFKSRYA